jgi:hypothetical protein
MIAQLLVSPVMLAMAACAQQSAPPASDSAATSGPRSFPPVGVAVSDDQGRWCVEFPVDSTPGNGQPVSIIFPGPSPVASIRARIGEAQPDQCHAEFPQPRWENYRAYRVQLDAPTAVGVSTVALAVAGDARWSLEKGVLQTELDGDGIPEQARRCAADEGEHFTIWSVSPKGQAVRRAHEYFDWGANVDATCGPGEDGS